MQFQRRNLQISSFPFFFSGYLPLWFRKKENSRIIHVFFVNSCSFPFNKRCFITFLRSYLIHRSQYLPYRSQNTHFFPAGYGAIILTLQGRSTMRSASLLIHLFTMSCPFVAAYKKRTGCAQPEFGGNLLWITRTPSPAIWSSPWPKSASCWTWSVSFK